MAVTVDMANPMADPGYGVAVVGSVVTISDSSVDYIVIGTTTASKLVIAGAVSVVLSSLSITAPTANAPVSLANASLLLSEDPNTPGGSLTAIGGFGSSGIGSSINTMGGNLTIQSGTISAIGYATTATIRFSGAGIGAGAATVSPGASFGTITINVRIRRLVA